MQTGTLDVLSSADVRCMTEIMGGLSVIAISVASGFLVLTEEQMRMLSQMESKLARIGTTYMAALRLRSLLEGDISITLSGLGCLLDQRISAWEENVRNHGDVSNGPRADFALILNGWVAHMSRWVERTKAALTTYLLDQHDQFTMLEEQLKGLGDHYTRTTGSDRDQPRRTLFALENSILNTDQEVKIPEVRPRCISGMSCLTVFCTRLTRCLFTSINTSTRAGRKKSERSQLWGREYSLPASRPST